MDRNIIQILKAGNQELFYSSFIAWLLDEQGDHGLGNRFSKWFFDKRKLEFKPFEIRTEQKIKGGRADIYLIVEGGKDIVIENKTKSIGSNEQITTYEDSYIVVPLGLVPENFPKEIREKKGVLTYSDILHFLKSNKTRSAPLSLMVDQFKEYLESMLTPFELFDQYCRGNIDLEQAKEASSSTPFVTLNDNDRRFFQAVYFERLSTYLEERHQELVFGESNYFNDKKSEPKPHATKWIIQKNLQGPAFMEAIIYSQIVPGKMRISAAWDDAIKNAVDPSLAPRAELWVDPRDVFEKDEVGVFELGAWDAALKMKFKNSGKFHKRGRRNFHYKVLCLEDLKYEMMAQIIKEEMGKVWDFGE